MLESDIMKLIMLAVAKQGHVLLRNNTATGWAGKSKTIRPGTVVIENARPLYAGLCKGGGDLIGWTSCGLFLSVEVKQPGGRLTPEQVNFAEQVNKAGGIAITATSAEEAVKLIVEAIYLRRLDAASFAFTPSK